MNVWFPSKYTSDSALVLKQYFLFVFSNGPRIIRPLDTSEASKGENVYCSVDKVYSQQLNIVPVQTLYDLLSCEIYVVFRRMSFTRRIFSVNLPISKSHSKFMNISCF